MKNTRFFAAMLRDKRGTAGFSLIELMVAIAVFAIVGTATLALFSRHAPLYNSQQNQSGLTLGLRTAMAQIEMDGVNAGSGYYQSTDIPDWPIGVTIKNNLQAAGTDCHTASTYTFGANCFDQLNIITMDQTAPPSHPSGNNAGTANADTSTGTAYLIPIGATTATQLATKFKSGDEVLFLHQVSSGNLMTTVVLTADSTVSGSAVQLTFTGTSSSTPGVNSTDPLWISNSTDSTVLTGTFNPPPANDYALRLNVVKYVVDYTTDPTNPALTRKAGNGPVDILATQIIGFKVGASTRSSAATGNIDTNYSFDTSTYSSDWSQIRAIRVSLIGRTTPNTDPMNKFKNSLDSGPYRIEGASVTINPRNMTMGDK
jgi:prepilin-type N-terminal cleavage/methylation domain-containing protein